MNLTELIEWTKKMQDTRVLKEQVKKDLVTGKPKDSDVIVCRNMILEIRHRAEMVIEYNRKAEKYMQDIREYFETLGKRGVVYPLQDPGVLGAVPQKDPEAPSSGVVPEPEPNSKATKRQDPPNTSHVAKETKK